MKKNIETNTKNSGYNCTNNNSYLGSTVYS